MEQERCFFDGGVRKKHEANRNCVYRQPRKIKKILWIGKKEANQTHCLLLLKHNSKFQHSFNINLSPFFQNLNIINK